LPSTPELIREALKGATGSEWVRQLARAIEQALGVDVVRVGERSEGLALEVVGHFAIIVGETGNWFFENWSIAHELAHIVRRDLSARGTSACDDPESERAANAFAAELLLPADEIRSHSWTQLSLPELAQFVWEAGVSTDALGRRLSKLGVEVSDEIRGALALKTQALLRRHGSFGGGAIDHITERMKEASTRRFPDHLIAAHYDAVSEGKVGAAVLAWMLGVDEGDLDEQLAPGAGPAIDVSSLAEELGFGTPDS
jgi:hypothetical protein